MARAGLKPAPLTRAQRAILFRALSRLQDAGLPADRAIAAMSDLLGPGHAHRFRGMSAFVARGASLAEAGSRFGLWSARDRRLIRLAERGGTLARAAAALADAYEYRARLSGKLLSRMTLPLLVLVLGLFLLPLPALVGGDIAAVEFLWRALGPLAALAVAAGVCVRVLRRMAAQGVSAAVGRLALGAPLIHSTLSRVNRLELVEGLSLLLGAGVPAKEALESALDALSNPAARRIYADAGPRFEHGGLSDALRHAGALEAEEFAICSASEDAGRVVDGLERVAGTLRNGIEHRLDLVSEWLPRGAYLIVALGVAGGLIA